VSKAASARRIGWVLLGLVAIGVTGWGVIEAYRYGKPIVNEWLEVREVTVTGTSQVTRQEVLDLLALQPGETLLSVHVRDLVEHLLAHPWIKEATVRRVVPHTLAVSIEERQAAAVLKAPSAPLLLDGEGHVLTVLAEADEPDLPLLTGIDPKALMLGEALSRQAAQAGIRLASLLGNEFQGRPEVDMGNPENAIVYLQGLRFQFGPSSFEEKWRRYRKITTHCMQPGNGCPTLRVGAEGGQGDLRNDIDLRYPGKVIVRERG
jgi:cell division protein FtsQ